MKKAASSVLSKAGTALKGAGVIGTLVGGVNDIEKDGLAKGGFKTAVAVSTAYGVGALGAAGCTAVGLVTVGVGGVVGGVAVIAASGVAAARRMWSGTEARLPEGQVAPEAWPFSDTKWLGGVRAMVVSYPLFVVFIVVGWAWDQFPPETWWWNALRFAGGTLVLLALTLMWTITMWNRPKMVVPPHLRAEPGSRALKRRRRADRRRARTR